MFATDVTVGLAKGIVDNFCFCLIFWPKALENQQKALSYSITKTKAFSPLKNVNSSA